MIDSLKELRELDISDSPITRNGLQLLQKMDHLCGLKISALNWLTPDDIKAVMEVGINLHITKNKGHDDYLNSLRTIYAPEIKARRDHVMKQ